MIVCRPSLPFVGVHPSGTPVHATALGAMSDSKIRIQRVAEGRHVCARVSSPARRRLGAPPPLLSPPPVPASFPATPRCKTLPSAPGFGYNPLLRLAQDRIAGRPPVCVRHAQASGSVQPVYPAGPFVPPRARAT